MKDTRDELIYDLNLILKENFSLVPLLAVLNVVDRLIEKGWKFSK